MQQQHSASSRLLALFQHTNRAVLLQPQHHSIDWLPHHLLHTPQPPPQPVDPCAHPPHRMLCVHACVPGLGWDPSLLQACAQNTSLIMSVEGLQTSPLYQRSMRGKRLGHETSVDHKLRIFKVAGLALEGSVKGLGQLLSVLGLAT